MGEGELASRMRGIDWSGTPLGPTERWPQSLRAVVRMMLASRYQMWMGWGPELTFLYNDAYRPTMGVKHPAGLATPAASVWREVWGELGPLVDHVTRTGAATYNEGMLLLLERSGYPEETYHTFSYSPLFDDGGEIAGLFCVVVEESDRIINDRRLATLRGLASAAAATNTESELFQAAGVTLGANSWDLPFTLCYLLESGGDSARLVSASGVAPGSPSAPVRLRAGNDAWTWSRSLPDEPLVLSDLDSFKDLPKGAWDVAPRQVIVTPIAQQGLERSAAGFIVAGVNPYRPLDPGYRGFVELLAGQIGAALANVRAYEAERRRAEALAEIDRTKTTFFSNVSHEFRTPLTLMLGPLEEALADHVNVAGPTRAGLELAHRNGARLLRLVNSLLDFSRIEAGRANAAYEATDLAIRSAEIASTFRAAVETAGMELRLACEPVGEPVYVDPDMWETILLNLISNAFKFTEAGHVGVATRRSGDGRHAEVRVFDTGVGVPPEDQPRLFERFHRVERGQHGGFKGRSIEGSGIGLALVQELVKLHGGSIEIDSTVGKGTCFTVRIPLGAAHLDPARVRAGSRTLRPVDARGFIEDALRWTPTRGPGHDLAPLPPTAARELDGAKGAVLLADDNADMRDYVGRLLEAAGYSVRAVGDGRAALDSARRQPPDLILTDVMMPELDGFGLLRAVRADPRLAGTPVIMLSARAGEESTVEGLEGGADDYLVKPFATRELLARVNAHIQLATARREAAHAILRSEQRAVMSQERLSLALSTGRVTVFERDIATGMVIVIGPLAQVFGLSDDEAARGVHVSAIVDRLHPADRERVAAAAAGSIQSGDPYEVEYRVPGPGDDRIILARAKPQFTPGGGGRLLGTLVDVTRERTAERALQALNASLGARVEVEVAERVKAQDALRQAQKMEAVGQLTGGVAHDFNNLLTVIIGGLDTIRRAAPEDHARIQRSADMALKGAQRAASLTERLLAFSRRQPLKPRPLEMNALVVDMTDLLHRTLGEAIQLERRLSPRPWRVEVDQNQLESAILNLAVNARDAMPEGGRLTVETANTVLDPINTPLGDPEVDREIVPGEYVMLAVADTGWGMTSDQLARAFEPFYTTKEVGRGTGLGLSMVYGFVRQSGGHVTLHSQPGAGTTARLYFPRYRGAAADRPQAPRGILPVATEGETILVVEDSEEVRDHSVASLVELGYDVLEASDADKALAILAGDTRIDLLFTDVVLPGRTGRALAEAAALLRPRLPVLYTTGYSRDAINHGGRLDADVILITKPFTFESLALAVRERLDGGPAGSRTGT